MKKIISALTMGALVGIAAFADVDVNLNIRQRASLYYAHAGAGKSVEKSFGWLDAYSGAGTDNFALGLSGDVAAFDIALVSDESTVSSIRAKKMLGSLFLGDLTLQAGFSSDGVVNGAYRAKSDVDAGNLEGMDFEFKKLGSAFKASTAAFVDNLIGHVNNANASEYVSFIGSYGLKFDTGALKLQGAWVTNESTTTAKAETGGNSEASLQGHQFSFIADGRLDGIGQAEAVFKYGQSKIKDGDGRLADGIAFALYAQPSITRNLILTVGGSGSIVDGDFTDYSLDLRARYAITPNKLTLTSFHSFSALTSDGEGVVANETVKGIANASNDNGGFKGTAIKRDKILSNNLMVRYKVNDTLTVFGIAADMIGLGKNAGADVKTAKGDDAGAYVQLRFSGWAQFFATSAAAVQVGLVASVDDATDYMDADANASWTWAIPAILRIKF